MNRISTDAKAIYEDDTWTKGEKSVMRPKVSTTKPKLPVSKIRILHVPDPSLPSVPTP